MTESNNEIHELTIGELDAVTGGAVDAFIWFENSSAGETPVSGEVAGTKTATNTRKA
jgi:hypothetical protein